MSWCAATATALVALVPLTVGADGGSAGARSFQPGLYRSNSQLAQRSTQPEESMQPRRLTQFVQPSQGMKTMPFCPSNGPLKAPNIVKNVVAERPSPGFDEACREFWNAFNAQWGNGSSLQRGGESRKTSCSPEYSSGTDKPVTQAAKTFAPGTKTTSKPPPAMSQFFAAKALPQPPVSNSSSQSVGRGVSAGTAEVPKRRSVQDLRQLFEKPQEQAAPQTSAAVRRTQSLRTPRPPAAASRGNSACGGYGRPLPAARSSIPWGREAATPPSPLRDAVQLLRAPATAADYAKKQLLHETENAQPRRLSAVLTLAQQYEKPKHNAQPTTERSQCGASQSLCKALEPDDFARDYIPLESIGCDTKKPGSVASVFRAEAVPQNAPTKPGAKIAQVFRAVKEIPGPRQELMEYLSSRKAGTPHIHEVYSVKFPPGYRYVMDLFQGPTLRQVVQTRPQNYGEKQLWKAVEGMCRVLMNVHAAEIVHNNIKLEHWIYKEGPDSPLVLLGLSKAVESSVEPTEGDPDAAHLTPVRVEARRDVYAASEIVNWQTANDRSDIWALGVCVYQLATGRAPFLELPPPPPRLSACATFEEKERYEELANEHQRVKKLIEDQDFKNSPEFQRLSKYLQDFLLKTLHYQPGDRLSSKELVRIFFPTTSGR